VAAEKTLHVHEKDLELAGSCVYCGVAPGATNDDVPPKNLFLRPLPENIVKVAACQPCNAGFSKDDEYMRLALYMRDDVMAHPTAQALRPDAWRAFSRPEAQASPRRSASSPRCTMSGYRMESPPTSFSTLSVRGSLTGLPGS
jgi:hypothetical protein